MATASLRGSRWARRLLQGAALLVVSGVVGGLVSLASAQNAKKPAPSTAKPVTGDQKVISDIVVSLSGIDQIAYINEAIEKKWQENKIEPSERCSDYEFIRRASLDIIGRIATVKEIDKFMSDPAPERRSRLIERLLESDEYAGNIANLWTVLLLTRSGSKIYHDQMNLWLLEEFDKKDADWSKMVTEILTASGKTNENGAVNFVLAHLGEAIKENPTENGHFTMVPVTSRTTRLFLGLRTQCTQCHDHPFNDEWHQSHFWGINAFFRQVDAPTGRPSVVENKKKGMMAGQLTLIDNTGLNRESIVPYERRNGVLLYAKPTFLDGSKMVLKDSTTTRRQALAKFVVKSDYFSKTFINRMWGHFFGRGFTREVDDWGEHNPVSHPELLERLSKDWATRYGYNPRELIRWICNSRAYGLKSVANPTNDKSDAEPFFGRMLLKAMTPEQLYESIVTATQAQFGQDKVERKKKREEWLKKLVLNFGDDEGNEVTFNGTVVQALLLMNGEDINAAIMDRKNGAVANASRTTPNRAVTMLYMMTLNRPPSQAELSRILSPNTIRLPRLASNSPANTYPALYQDLMWALLNCNEFVLNH
jgi:Protein of unknown function (DUF1549)/Protein of unknown function (DUF1553)